jgi:predicted oxidoreductase
MKWGCWGAKLGPQAMMRLMEQGIELGVTTFDHADIYGDYTTEEEFGSALHLNPGLRAQMQIVTKCGICMKSENRPEHIVKSYDVSKGHIITSVERSLKNLRTTYIDLLLIHRPSPLLAPDVVAEAFSALKRDGKVLDFGVSNFSPAQFSMLNSSFPLVTNQVEGSLLHLAPFTDGTFDQALQLKTKPMVWGPLGSGKLFTESKDPQVTRIQTAAKRILEKRGLDYGVDQLLLAWLLHHPAGILPVLGTTKTDRVEAAVKAFEIKLTDQEWFSLFEAARGHEVA